MPDHLDELAQREWKRLVPILDNMGVLTCADGIALGNLCQAYSTMIQAQRKISKTGLILKTPSGYVQQSPLLSIVNSCVDTITKISKEFGLTPASRVRLTADHSDSRDEIEALLCG